MPSQDEETLRDQLVKRIRGGESLEVEFKRGKGGLPDEIWPTASAFANTNGGWIIVGIRETEDGIEVEGASKPEHRLQEVNSLFRNHQKISHPVCGSSDVSIMELKGKPLLVMRIRAVSRRQRPVYINGNPYAGTYVRRHEGDYTCNKAEVDRMMREASDVTADSAILEHFDASDIDEGALSRYRQRFQNQNIAHAWNDYDDARFLRAIEAYDKERDTGKEGLTVAGLLLLGKREAIRDWRPRHLIDYRLLPEGGARERWDDRITWDGNLLGAFEEIYPKLVDSSATPFRLNEGGSRSGENPTQVATREALINLLVHTDYAESQAAVIFHHGEGYFFRNPGSSRVSKSDLLSGDRSEPRNPVLVTMFRLVGLAEEAGTGIPSIFQAWRELGYQYPDIDVGTDRYEFKIKLHNVHLLSEEERQWLEELDTPALDEAGQLALVHARQHGSVNNAELRDLTGQHSADASKTLGWLRDKGLLSLSKMGRDAYYELREPASSSETPAQADDLSSPRDSPDNSGDSSTDKAGPGSEEGNLNNREAAVPERFPHPAFKGDAETWAALEKAASAPRGSSRMNQEKMDAVVFKLCDISPLSKDEIAHLINRGTQQTTNVLRRLMNDERVRYLHPETPSHPNQKYVASQSDLFSQ